MPGGNDQTKDLLKTAYHNYIHFPMPYKIINHRKYCVIRFNNEDKTNNFLEKNPMWGVIQEIISAMGKQTIYVARITDNGITVINKINNV